MLPHTHWIEMHEVKHVYKHTWICDRCYNRVVVDCVYPAEPKDTLPDGWVIRETTTKKAIRVEQHFCPGLGAISCDQECR